MSLDTQSRDAASGDTVSRLQEMLQSVEGDVHPLDMAAISDGLDVLSERLMRIRGWGGDYRRIDFSPAVKNLLKIAAQHSGKMLVT